MKINKILAAFIIGVMAFGVGSLFSDNAFAVSYAAKSGVRMKSSAKPSISHTPKSSASSSASKAASPNQKDYQPSKKASELEKEPPASKAITDKNVNANSAASASSSSRFGSVMRNVGLFAGGMMLGGLLSSALGMGGMGAELLGGILNIIMIGVIIMAVVWLIKRFRSRNKQSSSPYMSRAPIDITPINRSSSVIDAPPPSGDYNPKTTADIYRSR